MEEVKASKFCDMCGTQVGQDVSVCPSCGKKLVNDTNVVAIIGFILSLIPATTMIGFIVSCVGLVISTSMKGAGKGLAVLGIIISIIYIVVAVWLIISIFHISGEVIERLP